MPGSELDAGSRRQRAASFGSVAAGYAAHRPDYPADAVAFLVGTSPRRVLDLGAGTGLLTDALLAAGHEVLAVDPSVEMLAQLRARHPDVPAHVGGAEEIPLPDRSVDAVVAGQAAHWFDPVPASAELRRVLRPGGVIGFVWNTRDETVPWVAALGADPVTQGTVTVREGRFGPYVTDGETNASLRKGDDVESITLERAAELLADRRNNPSTKKATKKKATAKKTTAKKATTTGKTTAKKATKKATAGSDAVPAG